MNLLVNFFKLFQKVLVEFVLLLLSECVKSGQIERLRVALKESGQVFLFAEINCFESPRLVACYTPIFVAFFEALSAKKTVTFLVEGSLLPEARVAAH